MPGNKNNSKQATASRSRRFYGLWHHVVNEWPQAVLVASIVTIMHLNPGHFGWFHAVDRYAYVLIGHLSALMAPPAMSTLGAASVAVVVIGSETHKELYLERSPLNRCRLSEHLEQLYLSQPRLVVIDLDLSPAKDPAPAEHKLRSTSGAETDYGWGLSAGCQNRLDELIKEKGGSINTVLLTPISEKRSPKQVQWMQAMEAAGVYFGIGTLPVEYNVVLSYYPVSGTLAQAAKALWDCGEGGCQQIISHASDSPLDVTTAFPSVLNFQASRPVMDKRTDVAAFRETDVRGKAVFLGAAYGEDDYFLTPIDEKYGVELHAATFASLFHPVVERHGMAFTVDVIFGLLFGTIISFCWRHYFFDRLNTNSIRSQLLAGPVWIGLLFSLVIAALFVLTVISLCLLGKYGLWTSPVPMAVGMLGESFVAGSVAQAIRVRHELDEKKCLDSGGGSTSSGVNGQPFDLLAAESHSLRQSIKRFAYLELYELYVLRRKLPGGTVVVLGLRRLAWVFFVLLAIFFIFHH